MKTVYFIRHAKSSWENPELPDHRRDLLETGIKRTQKISQWLMNIKQIAPELFISSPATRAYKTASIIASYFSYPADKIVVTPTLYPGSPEHIMETLYALPNSINQVVIVAHNPVLTELVNSFLESDKRIFNFPTSAVAAVRFETNEWEKIDLSNNHVDFLITPKNIRSTK
ncbi:MAG: histidine phosphatase family protein [Bacteroidales bacterium]|nr:histidine phosphatase family protein [Bacteroidales bacterium]